jgi:pectinesterase
MVRLSLGLAFVSAAVLGAVDAYFLPPKGAITVGSAHTGAKYATLAAALNDTTSDVYFIYGGNYTASGVGEQIYISRPNVRVYGQTLLPFSYLGNSEYSFAVTLPLCK